MDGKRSDHVALDETVIQFDDPRYWLYAAVDPRITEFLHVKLCSSLTTALTSMFLTELRERHNVDDAVFLIDTHRSSKLRSTTKDSDFDTKDTEIRTRSNISYER